MSHAAHRLLWTIVGLLLIALGAVGVTANLGQLPGTDVNAPLLWSGLLDLWRNSLPWGPIVVIVLGLLLAWLGFRLLAAQLRTRRGLTAAELTLPADAGQGASAAGVPAPGADLPGRTFVRGTVLAHGLERDLARDPHVRRAFVTLTGDAPRPELWIQLEVGPRARLDAVRDHVGAAVGRFSTTSGLRPRYLDVTARVDPSSSGRVR
jgi:hypothetical protein